MRRDVSVERYRFFYFVVFRRVIKVRLGPVERRSPDRRPVEVLITASGRIFKKPDRAGNEKNDDEKVAG